MKWHSAVVVGCAPFLVSGQLTLVPEETIPAVFAGPDRPIRAVFHNAGAEAIEANVQVRLSQLSSATVIPLAEKPWKTLPLLAGQTVLESLKLDFPNVRAGARFLVQWLDSGRQVLGTTEVMVYPTNALCELTVLGGGQSVGVFDPNNELKPLLAALKVSVADLERTGPDELVGHLVVIGPFATRQQLPSWIPRQVITWAKRGTAVVLIQPPKAPPRSPETSDFLVRVGRGAVVVATADSVARLAENPLSQLNLIRLARMAVKAEMLDLSALIP